ncbi:hypothetical protein [Symmachiella dynata]|uniref:hypothetical protein n=1 Tax=Symmachiella dynata TaxID=2527995 RepID=UPI0030EBED48
MARIVAVNNLSRGYARLGSDTDQYIRGIANFMEQRGYEREMQDGDIWMRYIPRRLGSFPGSYSNIIASCRSSAGGGWNLNWIQNLDTQYDQGQTADITQCRQLLGRAATDPDHRFLYWLDATLAICRRADRLTFIRDDFLPAFSQRFPDGRVLFLSADSGFEARLPLLRLGNYYQINGGQAYDDMRLNDISSPNTASALHQSGVIAIENALTVLLANFLPLRTHMVGRRIGWRAIFLFGNQSPPVIDRGSFPREEIELQTPQFFLRGDDPVDFTTAPADPLGGWSGRYRNAQYPGDDAVEDLIAFFLNRFNAHTDNRIEVCNFVEGDNIDFISCFEKYLTIDRILLECIMIATATNPATARLMTFAILDKFQELCRFPGIQQGRNFHHMCTRPFLNDVLLPSFAMFPSPWNTFFSDVATGVYSDLYTTIRSADGVWPTNLIQAGGGVRVYREWDRANHQFVDRPAPLNDDEFVGEYVRAARNTHHGYISDNDRRRRFACFGSVSKAFLPDSFTQLPLLIVLAEFVNPRALSGHHWLDQANLTFV